MTVNIASHRLTSKELKVTRLHTHLAIQAAPKCDVKEKVNCLNRLIGVKMVY